MSLRRRVAGLLIRPASEWRSIANERDEIAAICQSYVSALALIAPLSLFGGLWLSGGRFLGAVAVYTAMTACMVNWVVSLGTSLAAAAVIDKLVPLFDGDGDGTAAFKLVAYACTPFWLLGLFYASATWQPLVLLGALWGAALLYVGGPIVAGVPRQRAAGFAAASILALVAVHEALRGVFGAFGVPYMGY